MKKIPQKFKKKLKREARAWDSSISKENPEEASKLIERADLLVASRPARQPVSMRLEDLSPDWVEKEKKINADTRPGIVASTPSKALRKEKN